MADHLIFTLTAALGSMGDVAGHERRGSWTWPGRSAILGLLAAASGVRRDGDFSALNGLSISVAVFCPGTFLRDYHTVQTVPTAAAKRPQSRPLALREGSRKLNTTITYRDYRTSPLYGVAVTGEGLGALKEALEQPVFTLYLGRKACPLSAPLAPKIVQAADAAKALQHITLPPWWPEDKRKTNTLYCDTCNAEDPEAGLQEARHDAATDRTRWHFSERRVWSRPVSITVEEASS